jgi:hypothetical protein
MTNGGGRGGVGGVAAEGAGDFEDVGEVDGGEESFVAGADDDAVGEGAV